MKHLNITLQRTLVRGEITEGHLTILGIRVCQTLENTISGLPAGRYPVTLHHCKQYSRRMLLVDDKRLCRTCPKQQQHMSCNSCRPIICPMIKAGNGIHGRHDGSILVGTKAGLGLLTHPKSTFDALYERIRMSLQRGNQVTLLIHDIV